jgi:hypothetical protein
LLARSAVTSTKAFAPSTWTNLRSHWLSYTKFCDYFLLSPLPLTDSNVIPFLQLYSESVNSYSTVLNVYSSIKTLSKFNGHCPSPYSLYSVNLFLAGLKHVMSTCVVQKLPVTPQLLMSLSSCVDVTNSFHICMWAAMLFMFFSFFRKSNVLPMSQSKFNPLKQVTRASITVQTQCLLVHVTWSKTIQYCQKSLFIPLSSVPGSVLCPVTAYSNLLRTVPATSTCPAFCYYNNGICVPLTYPVFVKQLRQWLLRVGVAHVNLYSFHSFRKGGGAHKHFRLVSTTLS